MISKVSHTSTYIKKIPNLVKDVSAPLTKLDLNLLEGIQKGHQD